MIEAKFIPFTLIFSEFSLDFCLDKQASIEFTRSFDHHGSNFLFAVVEIRLQIGAEKHLIVPSANPGNFLEDLKDFQARTSLPLTVPGLDKLIPCGGWCSWMAGYWDRIDQECPKPDDEEIYDLLIPLSFVESRVGQISIYQYEGRPIVEVAIRPGQGRELLSVWSEFSSENLTDEIFHLGRAMESEIRKIR